MLCRLLLEYRVWRKHYSHAARPDVRDHLTRHLPHCLLFRLRRHVAVHANALHHVLEIIHPPFAVLSSHSCVVAEHCVRQSMACRRPPPHKKLMPAQTGEPFRRLTAPSMLPMKTPKRTPRPSPMTPDSTVRVAQLFMNSSCIMVSIVGGSIRWYCFFPGLAGAGAASGTGSAIGAASVSLFSGSDMAVQGGNRTQLQALSIDSLLSKLQSKTTMCVGNYQRRAMMHAEFGQPRVPAGFKVVRNPSCCQIPQIGIWHSALPSMRHRPKTRQRRRLRDF